MIRLRLLGPLHLVTRDGSEARAVLTQPKRLALLAYLAIGAPGGFHRRDALLALFWPESTESHARLALRQSLYHLRRTLGREVIVRRGRDELALAAGMVWCDVLAFRQALAAGHAHAALDLYAGDLLDGFSFSGISLELERWLDDARATLRTLAARAAASLSQRAAEIGELSRAVEWARRALALSTDDEPVLRHLVRLLDRQGNRAAALRTVQDFTHRTLRELAAEPAAETKALADEIRSRATARPLSDATVLDDVAAAGLAPMQQRRAAVARGHGVVSHRGAADQAVGSRRRTGGGRVPTFLVSLLIAGGLGAVVARLRGS
ncbi:MAG TPA: BTAD domain-containing putative transcriptional regulator [Gemmatimonadaceae bacterium]